MSTNTEIKTWRERYMDSLPMTEPMACDAEVAELRAALEAAQQQLALKDSDYSRMLALWNGAMNRAWKAERDCLHWRSNHDRMKKKVIVQRTAPPAAVQPPSPKLLRYNFASDDAYATYLTELAVRDRDATKPDSGSDAALVYIPTWEEETLCISSDTAAEQVSKAKSKELYALRKALGIRRAQECVCGACGALWQFWPKEQSGFGQDTLSLKSKKSCDFCEHASFSQLDWLRRLPDSKIAALAAQPSEQAAGGQSWRDRCNCNMVNIAEKYPDVGCASCGKPGHTDMPRPCDHCLGGKTKSTLTMMEQPCHICAGTGLVWPNKGITAAIAAASTKGGRGG